MSHKTIAQITKTNLNIKNHSVLLNTIHEENISTLHR